MVAFRKSDSAEATISILRELTPMKVFFRLVWDDLKRLFRYRIIYFVMALTFLFGMSMIFFPGFSTNFLYISLFILPVIIFSISLFIEREEGTVSHLISPSTPTLTVVATKILSATIVELIPFVGFVIGSLLRKDVFSNDIEISYFLLFLAYVLGVILHIVVGLSLSIIAKSSRILSLSYLAYIVVFSISPILYSNGIIPEGAQYWLIISPAFLSGVLIDTILSQALSPQIWLLILSVGLQIGYTVLLIGVVVVPYFKQFVIYTDSAPQK